MHNIKMPKNIHSSDLILLSVILGRSLRILGITRTFVLTELLYFGLMHLNLQKKGISTDTRILAQFKQILT